MESSSMVSVATISLGDPSSLVCMVYDEQLGVILRGRNDHTAHWLLGWKWPTSNRTKMHWLVQKNTRKRRTIQMFNCSALLIYNACALLNKLEMYNTILEIYLRSIPIGWQT